MIFHIKLWLEQNLCKLDLLKLMDLLDFMMKIGSEKYDAIHKSVISLIII